VTDEEHKALEQMRKREWEREAKRKWKNEGLRKELERWKDETTEIFQRAQSFVQISDGKMTSRIVDSMYEHMVHEIARIFSPYSSTISVHLLRRTTVGGQDNYSRHKRSWDKKDAYPRESRTILEPPSQVRFSNQEK
jgi:hypothetical protein